MKKYKKEIMATLTKRDLLEQLAEESAELAKAAIKMIRASGDTMNVTPTSEISAYRNLEEEINDVLMVIEALGFNLEIRTAFAANSPKWERWYRRVTGEEYTADK